MIVDISSNLKIIDTLSRVVATVEISLCVKVVVRACCRAYFVACVFKLK